MTQQIIYGIHSVTARLNQPSESSMQLHLLQGQLNPRLQEILLLAGRNKVPVTRVDKDRLSEIAGSSHHQGVVLVSKEVIQSHIESLEDVLSDVNPTTLLLILDGVQDPHNLGACLRVANAAGVTAVIAPKDNAVGITPTVSKVASGAAEVTPYFQVTNLARTLAHIKEAGIWVYGFAGEAEKSIYDDIDFKGPIAIVLGAEGSGLRRLTRETCDFLLKLPMLGTVESLNVSVATGISLYEIQRQRLAFSG